MLPYNHMCISTKWSKRKPVQLVRWFCEQGLCLELISSSLERMQQALRRPYTELTGVLQARKPNKHSRVYHICKTGHGSDISHPACHWTQPRFPVAIAIKCRAWSLWAEQKDLRFLVHKAWNGLRQGHSLDPKGSLYTHYSHWYLYL